MLMSSSPSAASLIYGDNDYRVVRPGHFVVCAVSGEEIPLKTLRYWSVAHQEAYASAAIATARLTGKA
jgi:hypothetical protein